MSDYHFTMEHPPLMENHGMGYVISHTTFPGKFESYAIKVPFGQALPSLASIAWGESGIGAIIKRQRIWKRIGEVKKMATKTTYSVTETVSQSLTETRSLRALVRLSTSVSAEGPFVSAQAELTAELEGTISKQESWTEETSNTTTVELLPDRAYAFWDLIDEITVEYDRAAIDHYLSMLENGPIAKKANKDLIDKLRALRDNVHKADNILAYYEDHLDDDRALLARMQGF